MNKQELVKAVTRYGDERGLGITCSNGELAVGRIVERPEMHYSLLGDSVTYKVERQNSFYCPVNVPRSALTW